MLDSKCAQVLFLRLDLMLVMNVAGSAYCCQLRPQGSEPGQGAVVPNQSPPRFPFLAMSTLVRLCLRPCEQ